MAYVLQFQKNDTLNGAISSGATSATLTSGSFGSPTGTQLLVIDYDTVNAEVISCTIAGTALTSVVRGLDQTSAVAHSSGAKVIMAVVPSHFTQLAAIAASDGGTSWTPTLSAGGSMTFGTTTVNSAKYFQFGKLVFFEIQASGTIGGTLSGFMTFTTPVTMSLGANTVGGFSGYDDQTTKGIHGYRDSTTVFRVYKTDNSNWSAGAGGFHGSGWFLAA